MNYKEATRLMMSKPPKRKSDKKGIKVTDADDSSAVTRNNKEDLIADAIDMRRSIEKLVGLVDKVRSGDLDVGSFFSGVAPDAAMKLANIALNGESEKVQLEALKDLLDRAGYSKVQKHAIASIDPNQPKAQLLALISGLSNKTKVIEIEDDEDQEK